MKKKNRAFLLIEALITVVLVSSSVILINHAFSTSLQAISLTNSYYEAVMFLDEKIFDVDLDLYVSKAVDAKRQEEVFLQTAFTFSRQAMALERSDLSYGYEAQDLGIERLYCELNWSKDGDRKIELVSYIPVEQGVSLSC
ncbi:MAG: hypothetical protein WC300_03210 [Candidatus Omnitrophota bacterium]|jgi:hypothetical protein